MTENKNDKVPLFSSWTHWYVVVILYLAVLIIAFYLLTKYFE